MYKNLNISLTPDQKRIHDAIIDFASSGQDTMTFGGFAGTGKTTTIGVTAQTLKAGRYRLAFCALGGKAANVLRGKLNGCLAPDDYCGTIHKLIYDMKGKFKFKNSQREQLIFEMKEGASHEYDLIILDEASMVNRRIFEDLQSLGIKILAVGDHGQLPPIPDYRDQGDTFNLMESPDVRLEHILRQAEGNPIVEVSRIIRETGGLPFGSWGNGQVVKTFDGSAIKGHDFKDPDSIVLCGRNDTRCRVNCYARENMGRMSAIPVVDDRVICLMNNYDKWIFNGDITHVASIDRIDGDDVYMTVNLYGRAIEVKAIKKQFYEKYTLSDHRETHDLFDYASAITVHKFQGSEAKNVVVYDEPIGRSDEDRRRWRYTAVTRAKERLLIIKK